MTLDEMEKKMISETIKRYSNNMSIVAKAWNYQADSL